MSSASVAVDSVPGPRAPSASAFGFFVHSSLLHSLRELVNSVIDLLPLVLGKGLIGIEIEGTVSKLLGAGRPFDSRGVREARLGKKPSWRLVKGVEVGLRREGVLASSGVSADVSELPEAPTEGRGFGLGGDFDGWAEGLLENRHTGRGPVPCRLEKMLHLAPLRSILLHTASP